MDTNRARPRLHRAQALLELAFGMFAIVLVVLITTGFVELIVRSLDAQREVRAGAGRDAISSCGDGVSSAQELVKVPIESLTAEYVFGIQHFELREGASLPAMEGINQ